LNRRRVERIPEYLQDILSAIAHIQKYTADVTFAEFELNDMMHEAVLLNLHTIGESSRRVLDADPEFAERHEDLDLRDAYAMRNRLVHDYDEVSLAIVWNTLEINLPNLQAAVERIRASGEANST